MSFADLSADLSAEAGKAEAEACKAKAEAGPYALVAALIASALLAGAAPAVAQGRGAAAGPPKAARESAPIDLTGYWVSYVTEDWRYRMMTPPKGDYARVPLTPEGRKVADGWNPAADEAAGN